MRVAVTGASGMIGRACAVTLAAAGHEVLALGRGPSPNDAALESCGVTWRGTNYEEAGLAGTLGGVDAMVHLASMRPAQMPEAAGYEPWHVANVRPFEALLRAAHSCGVGSLCLASSISVYSSRNTVPYRETEVAAPRSWYGLGKLVCEQVLAMSPAARAGMRWTALRIAHVVGPDRTAASSMLMQFMDLAARGEPLPVWGRGSGARDYVHVSDVVEAIVRCLPAAGPRGVFNVGGGRAVSHLDFALAVAEVYGHPGHVRMEPSRPDDPEHYHMDCSCARAELGWTAHMSLHDAVAALRDELKAASPPAVESLRPL